MLKAMKIWVVVLAIAGAGCDDDPPRSLVDAGADAARVDAVVDVAVVPAALGEECELDPGCQSGICADGVCCASACVGPCRRCDTAAQKGQCALLAAQTPCGGNICVDFTAFRPQAFCDSAGVCLTTEPIGCAPSRCLNDACVAACTRDDECQPPATCKAGSCRSDWTVGDAASDAPADAASDAPADAG